MLSSLKPPSGNSPAYRIENKPTCKEGYYKQGRTKAQQVFLEESGKKYSVVPFSVRKVFITPEISNRGN